MQRDIAEILMEYQIFEYSPPKKNQEWVDKQTLMKRSPP